MKKLLPAVIAVSTLGLAGAAYAAEYVNVYTCEMKEGAEMDDVQAANSKWLKWVQDNVDESIKSSVGTSVVGNQEIFIFVDTYPSLTVWAAAAEALDSDAADALEDLFEDTNDCSENRLWKMEETK